jgi:hypothetical protein
MSQQSKTDADVEHPILQVFLRTGIHTVTIAVKALLAAGV